MPGTSVPVKRPSSSRKFRKSRKALKPSTLSSGKPTKSPSITTAFPQFSLLPVEIRLRIWAYSANGSPRNLDIWNDYTMCNQGNTTFYHQKYFCHLANKSPHPILGVCHESREEGLKHFTLEYKTVFPHRDIKYVNPARFYINYASDTLIPRGFWNISGYNDFRKRNKGKLRNIAVDVSGSFWRDQLVECIKVKALSFEGLENLVLYDTSRDGISKDVVFGERDHFEEFEKRWDGGRKGMRFVEAEGGRKKLKDGVEKLVKYFKKQNGENEEVEVPAVVGGEVPASVEDAKEAEKKTEFIIQKGDQVTRIHIKKLEVV